MTFVYQSRDDYCDADISEHQIEAESLSAAYAELSKRGITPLYLGDADQWGMMKTYDRFTNMFFVRNLLPILLILVFILGAIIFTGVLLYTAS